MPCERELNNRKDPFAVAVVKPGVGTVGHVPRLILSACSIFIRRGGSIACQVTGPRRYSRDLSQGGVEIPCKLTFVGPVQDTNRLEKLVREALLETLPSSSNECDNKPLEEKLHNQHDAVPAAVVVEDDGKAVLSIKRKFTLRENDFEDIVMGKQLTRSYILRARAQWIAVNTFAEQASVE